MSHSIFKFGIFWSILRQAIFLFITVSVMAITNGYQVIMLIGLSGAGFASVILFLLATLLKDEGRILSRFCFFNQIFQMIFALFFYFSSTLLIGTTGEVLAQVIKGILLLILIVDTYIGYMLFRVQKEGEK